MTETTDRSALSDSERKVEARNAYRESVAVGMPLSGAQLGRMYGRTDSWGRTRVREVKAESERNGNVFPQVSDSGGKAAVVDEHQAETGVSDSARPEVSGSRSGKGYALTALLAGIGVSIAGNVMSVRQESAEPAAWAVAAFWPFAVYLAIEVITRVQWPEKGRREWWQTLVRFVGAGAVGLVAAIVSYRHMAHLLASWGEDGISVTLGPLAVDGLVAVAATALYVIKHDKEAQK